LHRVIKISSYEKDLVKDAESVGDFVLILIISINIHAKKRNKKTVFTTTSNPTKLAAQPEHN
jgi:hypothetical protein